MNNKSFFQSNNQRESKGWLNRVHLIETRQDNGVDYEDIGSKGPSEIWKPEFSENITYY